MPRDFLAFLNTFAWVMRWPSPSNPAARALSSSLLTARALSRSAALKNFTTCASAGRTVIRGHLNDPAFYDKMSALLKEILADLKALRIDYETFLKRIGDLAKQVQAGKASDTPEKLNTPGKRALYNNLNKDEA